MFYRKLTKYSKSKFIDKIQQKLYYQIKGDKNLRTRLIFSFMIPFIIKWWPHLRSSRGLRKNKLPSIQFHSRKLEVWRICYFVTHLYKSSNFSWLRFWLCCLQQKQSLNFECCLLQRHETTYNCCLIVKSCHGPSYCLRL